MYLDRSYQPRRRRRGRIALWPFFLVAVIGIVLYEQQPAWLTARPLQPTPVPTRSAISLLADADRLLLVQDYEGAMSAYREVARLEPDNPESYTAIADIQLMLRNFDASFAAAERAVQIAPEDPNALASLSRILDWRSEYELSIQRGLEALEYAPDNPKVLAVLGEAYSDVRNFPIAEKYLADAFEIDPNNVLVLRNLAYLQEMQGEYEEAIRLYDQAIAAAPNRFDLYLEKGRQYEVGLLDLEKADENYTKAVELYQSALTLDAQGYGVYNLGDPFRAVNILRKAKAADPEYGLARVHLGMAYYALRNYEDAVPELEAGVKLLGDEARIEHIYSLGLAYIYKEDPECDKAIPWLQRALEIEPESGPALDGLARCRSS